MNIDKDKIHGYQRKYIQLEILEKFVEDEKIHAQGVTVDIATVQKYFSDKYNETIVAQCCHELAQRKMLIQFKDTDEMFLGDQGRHANESGLLYLEYENEMMTHANVEAAINSSNATINAMKIQKQTLIITVASLAVSILLLYGQYLLSKEQLQLQQRQEQRELEKKATNLPILRQGK